MSFEEKMRTVQEIKDYILKQIKKENSIRISNVNHNCYDESEFKTAIKELEDEGKIERSKGFIHQKGFSSENRDKNPKPIAPNKNPNMK